MPAFRESLLDIPPVWLALFLGLGWAIARLLPVDVFGGPGRVAGALLVLGGLGLMAAAVLQMARHRTTVIPHRQPAALVTDGIFRLSRNPIYLGDALILAGAMLWWRSSLGLLLVPVFMALIQRRFILAEETRLAAAFGTAFAAWSTRTRRWI